METANISRKHLLTAGIGSRRVTKVEIKEIVMEPGQIAPYHRHPCPVVGHVVSGVLLFQIEGEAQQILRRGEAFYEPADTPIVHFDNASGTEPMVFIAYYLVDNREELIEILPSKES